MSLFVLDKNVSWLGLRKEAGIGESVNEWEGTGPGRGDGPGEGYRPGAIPGIAEIAK